MRGWTQIVIIVASLSKAGYLSVPWGPNNWMHQFCTPRLICSMCPLDKTWSACFYICRMSSLVQKRGGPLAPLTSLQGRRCYCSAQPISLKTEGNPVVKLAPKVFYLFYTSRRTTLQSCLTQLTNRRCENGI